MSKQPVMDDRRLEGSITAPEFPEGLEWLNTQQPLSIKDLEGKVVLLDFWTYCCINCMHVMPELKKLEAKYPEELVVIGVHSGKFQNEKKTNSIRQAVIRYDIEHPVVNDYDMEIWESYAVRAWPTFVLINPKGKIIGTHAGEGPFDLFDAAIAQTIDYFDKKGELKRSPLKLALEESKQANLLLSYPGKVKADSKLNQLFISDTNHNRIIISDPFGEIIDSIGSGMPGKGDGKFEMAEFLRPQGTFFDGQWLYIADTENHLIRRAHIKSRRVETVLGTGKKGTGDNLRGEGRKVPLSSPWDLWIHKGKLYIAMAGVHQLYVADMKTWRIQPFAGSGQEARMDGPLIHAALAQPSALTMGNGKLFFIDSETSSVRSADFRQDGKVETIIGHGLFEFGDVDGPEHQARLQHPLGIVFDNGLLYVADTYNSKIKFVNPWKKTSQTFAGAGAHGYRDGSFESAEFFEPEGVTALNGRIYVADTNNHQIRVLDPETRTVSTLELRGYEKLARNSMKNFHGRVVQVKEKKLGEGSGSIRLSFKLPEGYKYATNAPFHVDWKVDEESILSIYSKWNNQTAVRFPIEFPFDAKVGTTLMQFDAVIYYCRTNSKICLFENVRVQVPVNVKPKGPSKMSLKIDVIPKA